MVANSSDAEQTLDFRLVSSFNLANLASLLSKDPQSPLIQVQCAPYGQVMQSLLNPTAAVWDGRVDGAIIWTAPENVSSAYGTLLAGGMAEREQMLGEVDQFTSTI